MNSKEYEKLLQVQALLTSTSPAGKDLALHDLTEMLETFRPAKIGGKQARELPESQEQADVANYGKLPSRTTINWACRQGNIKDAEKINGAWRFPVSSYLDWLWDWPRNQTTY